MLESRTRKADWAASDGQDGCGLDCSTELTEVLSSTDGGRTKISLISKFGEKTDDIYGGKIAICKSFRRSTKSTGTQILRSVSALGHDSRRAGLPNGVAGCGDHGTHWSVSLCLASSTL